MISEKLHQKITHYIGVLQRFSGRKWYPALIGFLAALDNIIVVIPNDGILISSAMLTPKRWFLLAVAVTIGSTLGAVALAALVELLGLPWILAVFPELETNQIWLLVNSFFHDYGLLVVFLIALSPLAQQPGVIVASLANTPLLELAGVVFLGRFIKFLFMAYIGSHAPHLLTKLWGLKGELKDAGISINKNS
jgi:membrane protein YqaA with SNARE-associated domain